MLLLLLGIVRLGFNLSVSVIYSPFWLWQCCHVVYCSGVIIVVCFYFDCDGFVINMYYGYWLRVVLLCGGGVVIVGYWSIRI